MDNQKVHRVAKLWTALNAPRYSLLTLILIFIVSDIILDIARRWVSWL